MNRVIRYTVVILLTLGGLLLVWEFREAVLLFVLSLAVGAAFRPFIDRLVMRGVPRIVAILGTHLAFVVLFIGLIVFLSAPLARELQRLTDYFAVGYTNIQDSWQDGTPLQQGIASRLPPLDNFFDAIGGPQGTAILSSVAGAAANLASLLTGLGFAIALSMYWSVDRVHFERLWLSLLPPGQRVMARASWREIEQGVGAYIRSEVAQAVLAGLLLGLIYSLMGLRYPALLAILGALAWLVPWLGAVLAIIPPFLAGLQVGWELAIPAALATLAVLLFMELVVEKRLFDRRRYSSILLVLMFLALGESYGLLGVLIAPPLAAAVQIAGTRLLSQPASVQVMDYDARLSALRKRLETLKQQAHQDQAPQQVLSYIERLEDLIQEADEAL